MGSHETARSRPATLGVAVLLLGGCAGGGSSPDGGRAGGSSGFGGRLTVLAAASLAGAFREGSVRLEREHGGLRIDLVLGGSQQLVKGLEGGAPGDVVATADTLTMDGLVRQGLVEAPSVFARNRLEIAVGKGNPRRVAGLADLARPDLAVVLADPAVPAGRYARQALVGAGVTVHPRSNELDVRAALQKVIAGDADAALVYATDVRSAGSQVTGVAIPDSSNLVASYPIAVVRSTPHREAARAFVSEAVSGEIQAVLLDHGFLGPP